MKDFDIQKKLCLDKLYKPDKSRKGNVDKAIIPIINHLNGLKDFYTTSSCSGRIQIIGEADKKPEVKWLYQSHEKAKLNDIKKSLKDIQKIKNRVWLRQENMILHVACRTMADADSILKISRDCGFRRSGIIADSNIIIVEICSTEKMDVPIAENGKMLVNDNYLKFIVNIANEKFSKGRERLKMLEKAFKTL